MFSVVEMPACPSCRVSQAIPARRARAARRRTRQRRCWPTGCVCGGWRGLREIWT